MLKRVGATQNKKTMLPENFLQSLVDAILQVLIAIGRIILLPFSLWAKAITRLAEQKNSNQLSFNNIDGLWPFFTFCKRLLINFVFDAIAFISYPIGAIFALVSFIINCTHINAYITFSDVVGELIITLVVFYMYPVLMAIAHDGFELMLLPIKKFINWCQKPAQQIDIDIKQRQ